MKSFFRYLSLGLLIPAGMVLADTPRQECLGRMTFDVPEDMQWATYDPYNSKTVDGGTQGFSQHVTANFDRLSYDFDGLRIFVSDRIAREKLEGFSNFIGGNHYLAAKSNRRNVEMGRFVLELMEKGGYSVTDIDKARAELRTAEHALLLTQDHRHDLGIADARFIGSEAFPTKAVLWRQQRIYIFAMEDPQPNAAERFKDLIARFEPWALYEIPQGPGVCLPYGFIRDDGDTHYEFKNSLRFQSSPNVIVGLLDASVGNPWNSKPVFGTENDYLPTYDFSKWTKQVFSEPLPLGHASATFMGWHLAPRLNSGERERLWFGLAHRGGSTEPLVALQVTTVRQGVDHIQSLTPPPEEVIPRISALGSSIEHKLGNAK